MVLETARSCIGRYENTEYRVFKDVLEGLEKVLNYLKQSGHAHTGVYWCVPYLSLSQPAPLPVATPLYLSLIGSFLITPPIGSFLITPAVPHVQGVDSCQQFHRSRQWSHYSCLIVLLHVSRFVMHQSVLC